MSGGTARLGKFGSYMLQHGYKLLVRRPHARAEVTTKLRSLCLRRSRRAAQRKAKRRAARQGLAFTWGDTSSDDEGEVDCAAMAESVADVMTDNGVLDDAAFAAWFVEQRQLFRPRSRFHLSHELRLKGVASDTIDAALAAYDEDAACAERWRRARKRVLRRGKKTPEGYLREQGFPLDTARRAVAAVEEEARQSLGGGSLTDDDEDVVRWSDLESDSEDDDGSDDR